jgi:uncharacterized protein YhbP (UPF0306 family)
MLTNIEQTIREYLPDIIHMSLATSQNNKPRVCEVHYVFDDELNLYFRSRPSRRHSKEIVQNPFVAGNIVTQHMVDDDVRGVYFEWNAELLDNVDENHITYKLYCERFGTDRGILDELITLNGHQFYKITVSTYYIFDAREIGPSQKYELPRK